MLSTPGIYITNKDLQIKRFYIIYTRLLDPWFDIGSGVRTRKSSCRQPDARDLRLAFGDIRHGERDVLLVCDGGEVQLSTKERAEVPHFHAGLPLQTKALLDLVACLGVDG